jgi:hypothetical protein
MPHMTYLQTDPSAWNHYRGDLAQILGETPAEEHWQALQSLPASIAPELLWRLRALHDQLPPAQAGIISFHPIHTPSSPEAQERVCGLCGGPLPQTLVAEATQRFRCELCAIAARLLLGYPILYEGSRESLPAQAL